MSKLIDLTGERFGKLTVVSLNGRRGSKTYWDCACDCGGKRIVRGDHLKSGETKDCGCTPRFMPDTTKHGMYKSRLYTIWSLMKGRCFNKNRKEYPNYGGRNISVCSEWLTFIPFMEWSLAHGYSEDLTLDRIDNDGNYCPENCRWVTRKVQDSNKRNNRYYTYNGETKILTRWAEEKGLPLYVLIKRIDKLGWPFERAISEPLHLDKSHKNEV